MNSSTDGISKRTISCDVEQKTASLLLTSAKQLLSLSVSTDTQWVLAETRSTWLTSTKSSLGVQFLARRRTVQTRQGIRLAKCIGKLFPVRIFMRTLLTSSKEILCAVLVELSCAHKLNPLLSKAWLVVTMLLIDTCRPQRHFIADAARSFFHFDWPVQSFRAISWFTASLSDVIAHQASLSPNGCVEYSVSWLASKWSPLTKNDLCKTSGSLWSRSPWRHFESW